MERLEQIEEIFHQALQRTPDERDTYVRQACPDDSDLRRQIVSLLEYHDDKLAIQAVGRTSGGATDRVTWLPGPRPSPKRTSRLTRPTTM